MATFPRIDINFDETSHEKADDSPNLPTGLHSAQIEYAVKIIDRLAMENGSKDGHIYPPAHQAITVMGERGAGKTTFLYALNQHYGVSKKRIVVPIGPPMDPTILEESDTFLVTITEAILRKCSETLRIEDHAALREKLVELSRCFQVLARQSPAELFKDCANDPEFFAYASLGLSNSGISISRAFHEFAAAALTALSSSGGKSKVFLLCIDDVDMAFHRGWQVLETLRKYLTTPHVVTVISGDLNLFETLTRGHFITHLKDVIEFEKPNTNGHRAAEAAHQIPKLSHQYLLKLLHPAHRIHLPSPRQLILSRVEEVLNPDKEKSTNTDKEKSTNIYVWVREEGSSKTEELLETIFRNFSHTYWPVRGSDHEKYTGLDYLNPRLSQAGNLIPDNMRLFIRILEILKEYFTRGPAKPNQAREAFQRLVILFQANLHQRGMDAERFMGLIQGDDYEWLAQRLIHLHNDFPDAWRMDCTYDDYDGNILALLLQLANFIAWQRAPGGFLRYFGKVVFPAWIWGKSAQQSDEAKIEFVAALKLHRRERASFTAGRCLARLIGKTPSKHAGPGYRAISSKMPKRQVHSSGGPATSSAEPVSVQSVSDYINACGNPKTRNIFDLFSCKIGLRPGRVNRYINIYTALARIGDAIDGNNAISSSRFFIHLGEWSAMPLFYESPSDGGSAFEQEDDIEESDADSSSWTEGAHHLSDELQAWKEEVNTACASIPPFVYSMVFQRLFENIEAIESFVIHPQHQTVGFAIRQWLVALISSLFIEECSFRGYPVLNQMHSISGDQVLVKNLRYFKAIMDSSPDINSRFIDSLRDVLPVTSAWLGCPWFSDLLFKNPRLAKYFLQPSASHPEAKGPVNENEVFDQLNIIKLQKPRRGTAQN